MVLDIRDFNIVLYSTMISLDFTFSVDVITIRISIPKFFLINLCEKIVSLGSTILTLPVVHV
jgi:hypothetical protein